MSGTPIFEQLCQEFVDADDRDLPLDPQRVAADGHRDAEEATGDGTTGDGGAAGEPGYRVHGGAESEHNPGATQAGVAEAAVTEAGATEAGVTGSHPAEDESRAGAESRAGSGRAPTPERVA